MKQKQILIQGEEFTLNTIPATKSLKIFKDILKLVGPSFAELNKENGEDIFAKAVEALFDNLDSVDVEKLCVQLVQSAYKGNMGIDFDSEFAGRFDKLFLLLKEIVEFNYGNVFTVFGSLGDQQEAGQADQPAE